MGIGQAQGRPASDHGNLDVHGRHLAAGPPTTWRFVPQPHARRSPDRRVGRAEATGRRRGGRRRPQASLRARPRRPGVDRGRRESSIGRKHYPVAIDRVRPWARARCHHRHDRALAVDGAADVVVDWEPLARGERPAGSEPGAADHADARTTWSTRTASPPATWTRPSPAPAGRSASGWSASGSAASRWRSRATCGRARREHRRPRSGPRPRRRRGFRNALATILGFEQNQIRVIAPEVGGAGVKFGVHSRGRAPRRWPRSTAFATALVRSRPASSSWWPRRTAAPVSSTSRLAVEQDGTITGLRVHVLADTRRSSDLHVSSSRTWRS